MSAKSIDVRCGRVRATNTLSTISAAVRRATRAYRDEIRTAHGYHALWLGAVTREQYIEQLRAHLAIRLELENLFDSLGGELRARNLANDEEKIFTVQKYFSPNRRKSQLLQSDLRELVGTVQSPHTLSLQALALMKYMKAVKNAFAPALLGILYMLEETVTCAGPAIARNLDKSLLLQGKATRYLRGLAAAKRELWELRAALDLITDYQAQVNVVTAANISYGLYRDLIDPTASSMPPRPARPN